MKLTLKTILVFAGFILLFTGCSSNDKSTPTYEDELAELSLLRADIEAMASASVCDGITLCKFIGLGSKPCGGPWSYLTYTTSIDVEKFEIAVKNYNQREGNFNTKWEIFSDCALTIQPVSVSCENNTCLLTY